MRTLLTQLTRFGLVGAVGFVVDVTVFNMLWLTVLAPGTVEGGPVIAKVISTSLAIAVNWVGNRYWAFEQSSHGHPLREAFQFTLVSIGGMAIGLACLWISRYAIGFDSLLADNIAGNGIGLALGTVFRFWLYRVWVFNPAARRRAARIVHDPERVREYDAA
ncbi:MAG: GtrA family protein [Homoserinimonas sp.]|nr:GtrA family protein [Homoserinimonas sp.]